MSKWHKKAEITQNTVYPFCLFCFRGNYNKKNKIHKNKNHDFNLNRNKKLIKKLFEKFDFDQNLKNAIDKKLNPSGVFRNEKISVRSFAKFQSESERDYVNSMSQTETQFLHELQLMRISVLRAQSAKRFPKRGKAVSGDGSRSNDQIMFDRFIINF